jgi:hypothetical protein
MSYSESTRGLVFMLAAVIVVGLSAIAGVSKSNSNDGSNARRGPNITFDEFMTSPLDGGHSASPEEADALVPFDVPMPQSPLTDANSVVGSWVWEEAGQVAITFESGIVMIVEEPQFPDAMAEFEGLIGSGSVVGQVVDVNESAGLVIEPGSDVTKENPGSLQFLKGDESPKEIDGVSITLYGDGVSGARLVEIAESIT